MRTTLSASQNTDLDRQMPSSSCVTETRSCKLGKPHLDIQLSANPSEEESPFSTSQSSKPAQRWQATRERARGQPLTRTRERPVQSTEDSLVPSISRQSTGPSPAISCSIGRQLLATPTPRHSLPPGLSAEPAPTLAPIPSRLGRGAPAGRHPRRPRLSAAISTGAVSIFSDTASLG